MSILDALCRREEGWIGPKQKDADLWKTCWEVLSECAEKDWNLDVKHVKAHRTEKEKKIMTQIQEFVEGNETADELAKAGADVDGVQMAAAKSAHFSVQVESGKDRDEIVTEESLVAFCAEEKSRQEAQDTKVQ